MLFGQIRAKMELVEFRKFLAEILKFLSGNTESSFFLFKTFCPLVLTFASIFSHQAFTIIINDSSGDWLSCRML